MHSFYGSALLFRQSSKHLNKLLIKAHEKENEKIAYDLWKSLYPKMMSGQMQFIGFSEFKEKILSKNKQTSNKSYEEIEVEMDQIIASYERQVK